MNKKVQEKNSHYHIISFRRVGQQHPQTVFTGVELSYHFFYPMLVKKY
jgi:hypothetical protein